MEDEVLPVGDNTAEVVIIDDNAEAAPVAGDPPAAPVVLQRIEPPLQSVSVTWLQSHNYLAVTKVLKNHTNITQFFLQFFKHVGKCDCRACELDLWKPLRLPAPVFEAVYTSLRMPLPIPQPQPETGALGKNEFHYLTLEEAFQHGVFTDEYQPFNLAERTAGRGRGRGLVGAAPVAGRGRGRPPVAPTAEAAPAAQPEAVSGNALNNRVLVQPHMKGMSIADPSKLHGVLVCEEADCGKPRCIF
eukprot:jgi/Tetstr1/458466/TSEL_004321.t1